MEQADVIIVGAGLLGCFTARTLSRYALRTVVLEAREDVCTGISRANTGVIYAGCNTKPGTWKTELCVRANASFDALCAELEVPFSRCGALMLSLGPAAEAVLRERYARGRANGVPGLALLTGAEAREREPILSRKVTAALWVPGTGTVNPWELGIAAFENARANGVTFRFREAVETMARRADGFTVETQRESYRARAVVNCAGLNADRVRELTERPRVRLFPSAADYLVLDDTLRGAVKHILFHEPERKGKGLTLVPTVDGNLLLGTTKRPWNGVPDMASSPASLEELRALCRLVVPELPLDEVIRSFASLRPDVWGVEERDGALCREARSISSFTLLAEGGLYSLIGIKTPGLTCARELGEAVTELLLSDLGGAPVRPDFDPHRRRIPAARALPETERAALIAADPAYGEILCRCREVSLGEAREAIRRGAVTVDGVKRRTGAGMGRCQGGYCMERVMRLLSEELGAEMTELDKDGPGSRVLPGGKHEEG